MTSTQVTVATTSAAPSMCSVTTRDRRPSKYWMNPTAAWSTSTTSSATTGRGRLRWPRSTNHSPAVSPMNRNTRSAWNWLICCVSSPLRGDWRHPRGDRRRSPRCRRRGPPRPRRTSSRRARAGSLGRGGRGRMVDPVPEQDRARHDGQRDDADAGHEPGVEVGEHGDAAEHRLSRDRRAPAPTARPQQVGPPLPRHLRATTNVATAMATRTNVSVRLPNSIAWCRPIAPWGVNELSLHRGHVGQPSPDRSAAPLHPSP